MNAFLHRFVACSSMLSNFKHGLLRNSVKCIARNQLDWVFADGRDSIAPFHLPEQTAIAAVLSDMDAELAALEQRRDKTRALKQAMMQELLTGKTRLVPAGGAHA